MKWFYPSDGKQTAGASFTRYLITTNGASTGLVFKATNLVIVNDSGTDDIEFSWDGTNTHGHVLPGEPLNLGGLDFSEIWIKKSSGSATFRIWAYAR